MTPDKAALHTGTEIANVMREAARRLTAPMCGTSPRDFPQQMGDSDTSLALLLVSLLSRRWTELNDKSGGV